jgi:hypothetical protein
MDQMRPAIAVTGAEALGDDLRASLAECSPVPLAFQSPTRWDARDTLDRSVAQEVVDMPVQLLLSAQVPGKTGFQATQGTAGIDVVSPGELEGSQPPDLHPHRPREVEMELVDATRAAFGAIRDQVPWP